MNTCSYQEKLFDWHDGRLSSDQKMVMTEHLHACSECREQLKLWQQAAQLFLHPLRASDSEEFVHQVMRQVRIAQAEEEARPPAFLARWTFPALALSMAGFASALLYVVQPASVSTDALLQSNMTVEGVTTLPTTDQILGSIVENP